MTSISKNHLIRDGLWHVWRCLVWRHALAVTLTVLVSAQSSRCAETAENWTPKIAELVLQFASARNFWASNGSDPREIVKILPRYKQIIETDPIRHDEKIQYLYAWLLANSVSSRERAKDAQARSSLSWLTKCIELRVNHVEAVTLKMSFRSSEGELMAAQKSIVEDYPLNYPWIWHEIKPLNEGLIRQARKDRFAEDKIDRIFSFSPQNYWHPARKLWNNKPVRIGDLWAEMNDFERAIHAYQAADISTEVDTMLRRDHPMWEKMAVLYEKQGNWDMALNLRLKQLATASEEDLRDRGRLQPRINEIVILLAKIGADEKVNVPATKHDLGKMRQIMELYFELGFPDEAMKVVEVMEKVAGKQLLEQRASVWEAKANALFECQHPSRGEKMDMWVIVWNEVWTYDKVVAVHKEAIAWAKKAEWDAERIKKLEDQITNLPDLLKYVKEPKNWKDLLEGKAKEPVW